MRFGLRFETRSEEATWELGIRLAEMLPERGVVLLIGELGSGKTTLAKGVIEGRKAAAAENVSSPTFTLIHEYGDPVAVYHVDLYRLESVDQARRIGLEDVFAADALVLVEWGDRFPQLTPEDRVEIRIGGGNGTHRTVDVSGVVWLDKTASNCE